MIGIIEKDISETYFVVKFDEDNYMGKHHSEYPDAEEHKIYLDKEYPNRDNRIVEVNITHKEVIREQ